MIISSWPLFLLMIFFLIILNSWLVNWFHWSRWLCYLVISVLIHLVSNLLLNLFQNLTVYKLSEWIQFLLMKQRNKVIAESPHFAFSMCQRVFHDYSLSTIIISFLFKYFLNSLFLCARFCICSFSNLFFKEHDNECPNLIDIWLRILRTLCEQDWYLIAFHHHIREKEL